MIKIEHLKKIYPNEAPAFYENVNMIMFRETSSFLGWGRTIGLAPLGNVPAFPA